MVLVAFVPLMSMKLPPLLHTPSSQFSLASLAHAVFLYTFLCRVATTTLVLMSKMPLANLDFDEVDDVSPLLEEVVIRVAPV